MTHLTTSFREFVKQKLIQETKKESRLFQPVDKPINKPSNADYIEKLSQEWDELFKEND